jgi:hypothetical protein
MKNYLFFILVTSFRVVAFGQNPFVLLEVEPKEAEVGEMLTITVKSSVQGEIDIDFPQGFAHGYALMNGMERDIDYNTGKSITYYYLSQSGAMSKAGTFKIGPAYVKKGNKVYRSNTVNITIKKENDNQSSHEGLSAKQLKQPAFGVIQTSKNSIYEGEPLVINAKVYAQFDASYLENYQEYTVEGVIEKHRLSQSNRITVEEEIIKKRTYYTFEYDKKVVFPNEAGHWTIQPYKLVLRRGFESMQLTSAHANIEVKPLPPNTPPNFTGGVGKFTVESNIDKSAIKQGEMLTYTVEIKGKGNLQNTSEPKIKLPKSFELYGDPKIEEDVVYGIHGAEGTITYTYNIQLTQAGTFELPSIEMAYFDPAKEKYMRIESATHTLQVSPDKTYYTELKDSINEPEKLNLTSEIALRDTLEIGANTNRFLRSPLFWTGVSAPLILAFIFGFWWRNNTENKNDLSKKNHRKNALASISMHLETAANALRHENWDSYYSAIEKGLNGAILLLIGEDEKPMNKAEQLEKLKIKQLSPDKIQELTALFGQCEQARYGLGVQAEERLLLLENAKNWIQTTVHA